MTKYSLLYAPEVLPEVPYVILITMTRDGREITRPIGAYSTRKAAAAYVDRKNSGARGVVFRAPVQWLVCPDWYNTLHPNWSEGE